MRPNKTFGLHVDFNPHSHEGSDLAELKKSFFKMYFNPHSHEGSDEKMWIKCYNYIYFNPHSHEGSDKKNFCLFTDFKIFQSTLPRRE